MKPLTGIFLLLLLTSPSGQTATPAEQLLGVLMSEVTDPQNRCRWTARQLPHLEGTLSLYRMDRARLVAEVDGRSLADTAGLLRSSVFETRLLGPATVTLTLQQPDRGRLSVRVGQQLSLSLRDGRGHAHPLFCGIVFDRRSIGSQRIQVSALIPRAGKELSRSRHFSEMRRSEVVTTLAQDAGLEVQIDRSTPESLHQALPQRDVADWLFMSRLAEDDDMQLTLAPGPLIHYAHAAFNAPQAPQQRKFIDMTWVDVVSALADEDGLQTDIQVQTPLITTTFAQNETNLLFAQDLAARHEHSAFVSSSSLVVRSDEIWQRNPALKSNGPVSIGIDDLARSIAARHRLPLTVRVPRQRRSVLKQREQTDSEFLFSTLAAHGMHLRSGSRGLLLDAARAPGDLADLLLSRVTVRASGVAGTLTRSYGAVRDQLIDPLNVPSRGLTLELGSPRTSRSLESIRQPSPPATTSLGLDLGAGDIGSTSRRLDATIAEVGKSADAREAFLSQLARVYRPTLLFLHRLAQVEERSPRRPATPINAPRR